jgi:hypothetical protein
MQMTMAPIGLRRGRVMTAQRKHGPLALAAETMRGNEIIAVMSRDVCLHDARRLIVCRCIFHTQATFCVNK